MRTAVSRATVPAPAAFLRVRADAGRQALASIRANALRSVLGALAIAMAVVTMATVVTALDGIATFARVTAARAFGSETFVVAQVGSPGQMTRREYARRLQRNAPIRRADVRFLDAHAAGRVVYAPSAIRSADVAAGGRRYENASVTGTGVALAQIRDLGIAGGRFFTADEEQRAALVAVIGADIAEAVFPGLDPLGRTVRVAGRGLTVVGVQARLGSSAGISLDRSVWLPLSTFERLFGAPATLQVFAKPAPGVRAREAEEHARATMRARRQLQPDEADSFDIVTPDAARSFVFRISERIGMAAIPISLMALIAAVVVVTNTVLVSVSQRMREIGVRRAVGATAPQITREVIAESTMLAVIGGGAGLLLVVAIVALARRVSGLPLVLEPATLVWSLAGAAASGIAAGWYPARRAAGIDVVAALRSE